MTVSWRSRQGSVGLILGIALGLAADILFGGGAVAADPGLTASAPLVRHPGLSQRFALLVVPGAAQMNPRGAVAHADEQVYRNRLREIGFDVLTVGPATRPDLDQSLRAAVERIPRGAEVAVFLLGMALSGPGDAYLIPRDAPTEIGHADALETEGIRIGGFLRRLSDRAPRQLVVVVDECRGVEGGDPGCAVDATVGSSGASLIAAHRVQTRGAGAQPVARRSSLRELLESEIVKEGVSFLQLYGTVRDRVMGSDLALISTSSLSTGFFFVPAGFFAGLPTECNQVDPSADAASVRGLNIDPLIRACELAVANWPYAPRFRERRDAAREQRAFQRGVASCSDQIAISAYGSAYPSGRFRRVVEDFAANCRRDAAAAADKAKIQAEEVEKLAFHRAVTSCEDRSGSLDYLTSYPTGRYRRQVEEFLAECRRREAELQHRTRAFLGLLYRAVSASPEVALATVRTVYAERVAYFGKEMSREEVIQQIQRFLDRWPTRLYRPNEGSTAIQCNATSLICSVKGDMSFDSQSAARNQRVTGKATFEYSLQFSSLEQMPKIVMEGGTVVERQLQDLPPQITLPWNR